jgi:hypothetical protein
MAADEDQTSNSRRRLLKALSSTPLVLTLRPNAAAATSAYHCITNIAEHPPAKLWYSAEEIAQGEATCDAAYPCYGYRALWYWDLGTVSGGNNCTPWTDAIIVRVPQADGSSYRYFDINQNEITDTRLSFNNSVSPPTLTIYKIYSGDAKCTFGDSSSEIVELTAKEGLFLVYGVTQTDATGPVDWIESGVYPQPPALQPVQGMTGTCMNSVSPGTDTGWTLANG